jgi:hypothetical protein
MVCGVAIQQRVTGNLPVKFAADIRPMQTGNQIEYKFNPKWSVSGTRNQNGGFGGGWKVSEGFLGRFSFHCNFACDSDA